MAFEEQKTKKERKDVVKGLLEESKTDSSYYFMLIASTLITTFGILINSESIVIGGMMVAPLLSPLLALALGLTTLSRKGVFRALFNILGSVAFVLLFSYATGLIFLSNSPRFLNDQIIQRSQFSLIYFYIALFSGLAASYSWIEPKVTSAFAGVAVSVSILPPLCVTGLSLAISQENVFYNSFQIFLANLVGVVTAAILVFLAFRFTELKKFQENEIQKVDESK